MIRFCFAFVLLVTCCFSVAAQDASFPTADLLPKKEIGASRYLKQHRKFDGRDVIVAVFDTGCDPAAPGLQVTSDGKPKIIDMIDATGSGDVRTTTVRKVEEGQIESLTGRKLTIPEKWNNPSGEYRVGMKPAYELFPGHLVPRLRSENRKPWDEAVRVKVEQLTRELEAFNKANPKPKGTKLKEKKELEARLEELTKLGKNWSDPGPIYDCVVFHDGKAWQAVIDTDEDGDLSDEKVMTNYKVKRQYSTFGEVDLVTFAVNIYQDGDVLSIVVDAGTHGTHVGGIIAANYPDNPELNGVAPGAQIVSVKIGDSRLGSNSTGIGEDRGLIAVLENNCDLINMSYGGPSPEWSTGRTARLFSEIVNRYGVIFVASAGNSGPALSTVGGPGGTTSAILGVGAYVSPELMSSAYSVREELAEKPFTWSSRGPTMDGDLGVDITAPGAAVSPVSRWALSPGSLMNGTSMSSPNACGGVALILSGLKQEKIAYTPESVKLAIKNTARKLEGGTVWANGHGLIQVDAAFDYLEDHQDAIEPEVRYEVTLPGMRTKRGVYLREGEEVRRAQEITVEVDPQFNEDAKFGPRADYRAEFFLKCDADWVKIPHNFYVNHGGRTFKMEVDPRNLKPGAHFASVEGYYADRPELGPRFRVPITVLVPTPKKTPTEFQTTLRLQPGQVDRTFIEVPMGATWVNVRVTPTKTDDTKLFVFHALQRLEDRSFPTFEKQSYLRVEPNEATEISFAVAEGKTLEMTLAQYWSTLGQNDLELTATFYGILPSPGELTWDGTNPIHRIDVQSSLSPMQIKPSAKFETLRKTLLPVKSEVEALDPERDEFPRKRLNYGITLTYEFNLSEKSTVTPEPIIWANGYDRYSGGVYVIYDANKRVMKTGSGGRATSLEKGKYTLTFYFRQEDRDEVLKLEDMPIWLDYKISGPGIRTFDTHAKAVDQSGGFSSTWVRPGQLVPVFLTTSPKGLPKQASPGDLLMGEIQFGDPDAKLGGKSQRPGGFPLQYVVAPQPTPKSDAPDQPKEDEPTLEDKLFETKLAYLKTLKDKKQKKEFDKLFKELNKQKKKHVPLLQAKLVMLDENDRKDHLPEVVQAADAVLAAIPVSKVRSYFAERRDPETDKEKKQMKEMTERKEAILDALHRKARAIAYMDLPTDDPEHPENKDIRKEPKDEKERAELFEKAYDDLASWVDTTDKKYALVHLRRLRRLDRQAEALQLLNKMIEDDPTNLLLYKKRSDIYGELGWEFAEEYEETWRKLRKRDATLPN
ncbi:S8 family serine peptidase [Bremerella sp. JC770]|uniref:S8 family serine peptidase n=1 Tax=Bremerella sp. JC770 TaxID=3232137 RepID=UPI0034580C24